MGPTSAPPLAAGGGRRWVGVEVCSAAGSVTLESPREGDDCFFSFYFVAHCGGVWIFSPD